MLYCRYPPLLIINIRIVQLLLAEQRPRKKTFRFDCASFCLYFYVCFALEFSQNCQTPPQPPPPPPHNRINRTTSFLIAKRGQTDSIISGSTNSNSNNYYYYIRYHNALVLACPRKTIPLKIAQNHTVLPIHPYVSVAKPSKRKNAIFICLSYLYSMSVDLKH